MKATVFGHPKGLFFLAFTEAWERFSFYGMSSLLVLYMVNQLLLPGHVEHIAAFTSFRSGVESIVGDRRNNRGVGGRAPVLRFWRPDAPKPRPRLGKAVRREIRSSGP